MQLGNDVIENPLVLGPMAGVTDWAFRTVCARLGANITVTEMVSSRALVYKDKKSAALLKKTPVGLCGAQIFGNDPEIMAQGAQLALEISGCDFLDINMGCPMPKIANSGDGCGLMRTPELAEAIVKAVVAAVDVPVTVKCRLGWDKGSINVLDFTKRMEQAGASMITVHGRTRSMLYSGVADWDMIRKVKEQLSVPLIANGDIVSPESALRCLKWTGADGLMIGRATFGDPWIFRQVSAALAGRQFRNAPVLPTGWMWPWSSSGWPTRTKGRKSPAWKPGSILPGTSGAYPTAATIRPGSRPSPPWRILPPLPGASSRICDE